MSCSTCDDYQLVDGEDGIFVDCPDCHLPTVCPVHGSTAIGRCAPCIGEARAAITWLRVNPYEAVA